MSLLTRYRWELAPLLGVASAGLLAGLTLWWLDAGHTTWRVATAATLFGTTAALLLTLPRVRRENRPLLEALWLAALLPLAVNSASTLVVQTAVARGLVGGPQQLGLLQMPGGIAAFAAVVWVGVRYARHGMRFAMLASAAVFAPAGLSTVAQTANSMAMFSQAFVIRYLTVVPITLAAAAIIVYVFHHAHAITPAHLRRWIIVIIAFGVAAPVVPQLPFVPGYELGRAALIVGTMALQAGIIGVTLGVVWLFSRNKTGAAEAASIRS